jgi:cell division protein FtsA
MNPERVIAGLDIGSAKTTVVIAEATGDLHRQTTLKILGVGQARTTGLRRGIVADIEETTRSIKKAIEDAERMAGTKIESIYAGIAGVARSGDDQHRNRRRERGRDLASRRCAGK